MNDLKTLYNAIQSIEVGNQDLVEELVENMALDEYAHWPYTKTGLEKDDTPHDTPPDTSDPDTPDIPQ